MTNEEMIERLSWPDADLTKDDCVALMRVAEARGPVDMVIHDLNPRSLMQLREFVSKNNVPVQYIVASDSVWHLIMIHPQFVQCLDPVSLFMANSTGNVGTMYGMAIISDSYFETEDRILDESKGALLAIVSVTKNKGVLVSRGKVT